MTVATMPARSPITERAVALVAERRPIAEALGSDLAALANDPEDFVRRLDQGFRALADPEYEEGSRRVAPNLGPTYGVRWPLMAAVARGFRRGTRGEPAASLLFLADRLYEEERLEARWFAFGLLERTVQDDPERTWQLLRQGASEAKDWITVDSLAHPYGRGIALEPYRWTELDQLVFAGSPWERRLVGSTIATMTHGPRGRQLGPQVTMHGLGLLGQLMGDTEPEVQKALAWAYRSLAQIDRETTTRALQEQATIAVEADDGHRAWVIRDALSKLDEPAADELRSRLAGIRRRPGAASTSEAARVAAAFSISGDANSVSTEARA